MKRQGIFDASLNAGDHSNSVVFQVVAACFGQTSVSEGPQHVLQITLRIEWAPHKHLLIERPVVLVPLPIQPRSRLEA